MPRANAIVLLVLLLAACGERHAAPPPMVPIGSFSLTDQDGRAFGSEQLRGSVWIGALMFTSCPDVCPVLTSQMANLHRRIDRPGIQFVSFSVDPEVDTPATLREYAARFRIPTERWRFLTGEPRHVRGVIAQALHLPAGEREEGAESVMHFDRLFLVDPNGVLRGYYETDAAGLERLERDALAVLAEAS